MNEIVVIAEGPVEKAIRKKLGDFVKEQCGDKPKRRLTFRKSNGPIETPKTKRIIDSLLQDRKIEAVVLLTDLHPDYSYVATAKKKLMAWAGNNSRVHVHVAKYEFEAWLLSDWEMILKRAKIKNQSPWGPNPEEIDGNPENKPSKRLERLFRSGKQKQNYKKVADGVELFNQLDLNLVAAKCPEFKRFINTLLNLCGCEALI